MQTPTESIDLRSVLDQLEQLKSGISAIIGREKALIKNRAERLLEKRAAPREAVNQTHKLPLSAEKASAKHLAAMYAEMQAEHTAEVRSLGETFRESDEDWKNRMSESQKKLERQLARIPARLEKRHRRKLAKIDALHKRALETAQVEAADRVRLTEAARAPVSSTIESDADARIHDLLNPWSADVLSRFKAGGPAEVAALLAATDTWNNVNRWIPRKLMAEFEMHMLFQTSANDSSNLIDSPATTSPGLDRALFHNEHHGTLETFRPYAMPDDTWLDELTPTYAESPAN